MFRLTTLVSALLFVRLPSVAYPDRGFRILHNPRILYEPCRDQEAGKFVKDRYACDKFFYCGSNHAAISVDCPHGMIFNDQKDICDLPWNYNCVAEKREGDPVRVTTPAAPKTTPTVHTSSLASTLVTRKPTHAPLTTHPTRPTSSHSRPSKHLRCPAKDSNKLVFLADQNNCHRYYICYHGHPMPLECIAELHWNPSLESCDFPENAGCSRTTTPTVMPPVMTTVSVQRPEISCPARGEHVLPHPEECNYFIYCVNGFPMVQQCPFFHHFDVLSKSCMWQTSAKCIVSKKTERAEGRH